MLKNSRLSFIFLTCLCLIITAAGPLLASESYLVQLLDSGSRLDRVKGAKLVYHNKIQNDKIFDLVEKQLLNGYEKNNNNPEQVDELSWYCKALSTSGNAKYLEALKTVGLHAPSDKVKKYAQQAYYTLESKTVASSVSLPPTAPPKDMSSEEKRVHKLLLSGRLNDIREAAKLLSKRKVTHPFLYDMAAQILSEGYNKKSHQHSHVDTMAWLCKAIGASGDQQHLPLLDTIAQSATNNKLKEYGRKAYLLLQ